MLNNMVVNKTVLITGGTSGIGLEIVKLLYRQNKVIVIGRKELSESDFLKTEKNIQYIFMDLSEPNQVIKVYESVIKNLTVDILINNAAVQNQFEMADNGYTNKEIINEINTNLTSCCLLIHMFVNQNINRAAAIINVSSGLALVPKKTSAVYCATKAALSSLTLSLRYQLSSKGWKIYQAYLPLVDTKLSYSDKKQRHKITAKEAAEKIIFGYVHQIEEQYVGEVKKLYWINRILPSLTKKIMSKI